MTLLATVLVIWIQGLSFPVTDLAFPLVIYAALKFVRKPYADTLGNLVLYSATFAVLVYALATINRPLVDDQLKAIDAFFGLSAGSVVISVSERPGLASFFKAVYFSLIPQTIVFLVIFAFNGRVLKRFLGRFMALGLVTAFLFAMFPAAGTYYSFDLPIDSWCLGVASDFHKLRSGIMTEVTWRGAEGIITFPSFHTIWTLLLARNWWLGIWSILIIISTVTTGYHYFTDVFVGILLWRIFR